MIKDKTPANTNTRIENLEPREALFVVVVSKPTGAVGAAGVVGAAVVPTNTISSETTLIQ